MAIDETRGYEVVTDMLGEQYAKSMKAADTSKVFGARLGAFALRFVFSEIWTRPGLSRRDRSLVTLGILIASRNPEELKIHIGNAIRNGVTVDEIEEVLYHAIPYAGFPAANTAIRMAAEVLTGMGLLPR